MYKVSHNSDHRATPVHSPGTVRGGELQSIRRLIPDSVLFLASAVGDFSDCLSAQERKLVEKAVPRRRNEFATGRMLAASALLELGEPVAPILQGSMNEPIWPAGVLGSITHTVDTCMVAVTRNPDVTALGIDLEARPADFDDLERLILNGRELAGKLPDGFPARDRVRLLFSAKESIYKGAYPTVQRFVDFEEVCIEIDFDRSGFTASAPDDDELDALVSSGKGRFRMTDEFVFTIWYATRHGESG